jgi:hypothetical protein
MAGSCADPPADHHLSEIFRPRRRPLLRLVLALSAAAAVAFAIVTVIWLRVHVVPPDCQDPETLALVRSSLTGRFRLPASVTIDNVVTRAGGYVAFRFACEADLHGIDPGALPPGAPVPGSVYYVSRLTDRGRRHEVTVSIQPLLKLEKVQ